MDHDLARGNPHHRGKTSRHEHAARTLTPETLRQIPQRADLHAKLDSVIASAIALQALAAIFGPLAATAEAQVSGPNNGFGLDLTGTAETGERQPRLDYLPGCLHLTRACEWLGFAVVIAAHP